MMTEQEIEEYCRVEREITLWERLSLAASALLMFLIVIACML